MGANLRTCKGAELSVGNFLRNHRIDTRGVMRHDEKADYLLSFLLFLPMGNERKNNDLHARRTGDIFLSIAKNHFPRHSVLCVPTLRRKTARKNFSIKVMWKPWSVVFHFYTGYNLYRVGGSLDRTATTVANDR